MADYIDVLVFSLVGGLLSLAGGVLLLSHKKVAANLALYATPFAAGALLAAALFELLPESISQLGSNTAGSWALLGIVLFFALEHFIHWFHHNHQHEDKHKSAVAPLVVVGDSVHNFIDGIAIGAAFLINVPAGIVTALAVAAHEIPQEIGDFGLLLKHGYERKKVLLINAASALMATAGALITFWLGSRASLPVGEMLAITAGLFIYIAASDLIPAIHHSAIKKANYLAVGLLIFGILAVGVTTELVHNRLENSGHGHTETSHEAHEHGKGFEIADHRRVPKLNIELEADSVKGYNLHVDVAGFIFDGEQVGGTAVEGSGHAHVYVNGIKVARIYSSVYYLPDVIPGDTVRVTLNANDHREFTHEGEAIAAEITAGSGGHEEHEHSHSDEHGHDH